MLRPNIYKDPICPTLPAVSSMKSLLSPNTSTQTKSSPPESTVMTGLPVCEMIFPPDASVVIEDADLAPDKKKKTFLCKYDVIFIKSLVNIYLQRIGIFYVIKRITLQDTYM